MYFVIFFCFNPPNSSIYNIYFACLEVYLSFVCMCPINVKTAEQIGPKFCVWLYMTPGKVYGWSKLQQNSIFIKFYKSTTLFYKIRQLFCFCFTMDTKRKSSQLKYKMGVKRPESLVSYFLYFSTYLLILYLYRGPCIFSQVFFVYRVAFFRNLYNPLSSLPSLSFIS